LLQLRKLIFARNKDFQHGLLKANVFKYPSAENFMAYRFLEHTADVQFEASGTSLEEAFSAAMDALKETVAGDISILKQERREIIISAEDLGSLLYKFLEEYLFLLDSQGFLVSGVESISIDKEKISLKAVVAGDKAENYSFTNDVKAVTYNSMFVKEEDREWKVQVVLDV
jgi:SHS2 domain-containing protein